MDAFTYTKPEHREQTNVWIVVFTKAGLYK